jgi:hypothetical protein
LSKTDDKKQGKKISFYDRLKDIIKRHVVVLCIVGLIGLIIRLIYLPHEVPLILDSTGYFWYAIDTIVSGHFPTLDCGWRCTFPNNGWPALLAGFFIFLNSNNFIDYMNMQRLASIVISVLTIIPVYLLCSRVVNKKYAVFGAALLVLNPRIIQNSLLGITEPLFILTFATALFLFLGNSKKSIYASFGVAAISSLIRYEGLLLLIPFSIMFFIRFRKEKKVILRYIVALSIFALFVLPMTYVRIETTGKDGLLSQITAGPRYYQNISQESDQGSHLLLNMILVGSTTLVKYLVLSTIPTYIFFIPIGLYVIFRHREHKNITLILTGFVMLMPTLYAYSRSYQEIRYLLILFPIFSIFAAYTISTFENRFRHTNIILIILICAVLLTSVLFLNYKATDYEDQKEAFQIAKHIYKITKVINYYPQGSYLDNARVASSEDFPELRKNLPENIRTIYFDGYNTLEEYINQNRNEGLAYLVIDKGDYRTRLIEDVFNHEEKYPYLEKVFDSFENGYTHYHVKIFKINFERFDSIRAAS